MIIVTFALITQLKNGSLSVSRHKPPDLYNNTRIRASDLTPEVWNVALVAKGGLLTLQPGSKRLPNNISDFVLTPSKAAYSCGTVEDSHLIP